MFGRFSILISLVTLLASTSFEKASGNLIINGDFDLGNTAFASQYVYAPAVNTTEGEYTVRPDPQNWNPFFSPTPDHTSGTGNMLVVNGATTANLYLWQQSVSVSSNTDFEFSSWISTAVAGGPAVLTVEVNGVQLGPAITAPFSPGTWVNWTANWNSGIATTADIRIFNSILSIFPNDFYVDDISFSVVPEPTAFLLSIVSVSGMACRRRRYRNDK